MTTRRNLLRGLAASPIAAALPTASEASVEPPAFAPMLGQIIPEIVHLQFMPLNSPHGPCVPHAVWRYTIYDGRKFVLLESPEGAAVVKLMRDGCAV